MSALARTSVGWPGTRSLVLLEWRRTWSILALFAAALLGAEFLARPFPLLEELVLAGKMVYPNLAALLLGVGLIFDDTQQRTRTGILALSISPLRLWATRTLARLSVLGALMVLWGLLGAIEGTEAAIREGSLPEITAGLLLALALLSFFMGASASSLVHSSFEAVGIAMVGMSLVMAVLSVMSSGAGAIGLAGVIVGAVIAAGASLDLLLRREPPGSRALWLRAAIWLVAMMAVAMVLVI